MNITIFCAEGNHTPTRASARSGKTACEKTFARKISFSGFMKKIARLWNYDRFCLSRLCKGSITLSSPIHFTTWTRSECASRRENGVRIKVAARRSICLLGFLKLSMKLGSRTAEVDRPSRSASHWYLATRESWIIHTCA